jgi:hypothetical protein
MMADHDLEAGVLALRQFVPAKDFDTSLRFYSDLGFSPFRLGEAMASMELGPYSFLLHAFDHENFASNFVMHLLVKNLDPWWSHISALDLAGRYGVPAPVAPELQPWGLVVAYVFDPSGILWHIAEPHPAG